MKNKLFAILILMSAGCMEGLPLEETPDAAVPTSVDATPVTPTPDATIVNPADADVVPVPDAMVPDAPVPPPVDAGVPDACPPLPAAPTLSFTATLWTITSGQNSVLSWSTTNASACVLSGGVFGGGISYAPNWSVTVSPTTTTNYWLVCTGLGGMVSSSGTMIVNPAPAPVVCHGEYNYYSAEQLAVMDHCTGWTVTGTGVSLPMALQVVGVDGVCAITCTRIGTGETMLPIAVSGVWQPGATADVTRWYTTGCTRLPDHPAAEPDQAGGTWDGRCDHPVLTLSGPPTP